ncbi:MAG: hypothetical protein PHR82_05700, partial [Endomicrobiaceae bacterium]|nr:hypothetical protein [Endomicrobiaceae bacterium]
MQILNIKINLKKVCSVVTALIFLFTVFNINLYASVKTGQDSTDNFLIENINKEQNVIPDQYGKITALSDNGSSTVVINIQDLHCDYSVQKNISNIIKEFAAQYPVQKIYVEGGVGKINTNWSKLIDDSYKDKVLDNLLKVGRLTGAEFYAITNNNKVPLFGIEDEKVYQENLNRYERILNNKQDFLKYIAKINREIDFLKAKYLSAENKKLNKIIDEYNKGSLSQNKYFANLVKYIVDANISLSRYPNLSMYLGLYDGSKEINIKKVMSEIQIINVVMKEKVSFSQYKDFIDKTGNMSDVKTLKSMLEKFCKVNNIDFQQKYPNLYSFLEFKNKALKFNHVELVKEEKELINDIRVGLSKDITDLEISYLSDFNNVFSKYLLAELTASQWRYFKVGLNKFRQLYAKYSISDDVNKIEPYFADLNKFYEINSKRDEIFVSNMDLSKNQVASKSSDKKTVRDVLAGSKNIVILVSGGFHSVGVDKILNNNNITTITVTPNLANVTADIAKQNYENILKQRKIQTQTIALKLLSNENLSEQTKQIILSMFPKNMDMAQISDLAKLAETVLTQDSKIDVDNEKGQISVKLQDGNIISVDVPKEVADIIAGQSISEVPKVGEEIVRVAGNNLQEILGYFKSGEGVFAPKVFEICKGLCIFAVNNKWYIGDGAIWEIEQARRSGKIAESNLDGVDPVVYEYMPGFMQKSLLSKETKSSADSSKKVKAPIAKRIAKSITTAIQIVLVVVMLFTATACGVTKQQDVQWQNPSIVLTDERLAMIEDEMETLQKFDSSRISETNKYPYLSFDYSTMALEDKMTLSTKANEDNLAGLTNLYDQSLVIMRLLQIGEIEQAEEMLTYFSHSALFKSNYENYEVTGEVVWIGIAAVQYKLLTGSNNFDGLITKVDKYLQKVAGSKYERLTSGFNIFKYFHTKDGSYYYDQNERAISAEHQFDVLVYFNLRTQYNKSQEMQDELLRTANYIYDNLYDKENNCFYRGYNDKFSVLDVHSWGLAAIISFENLNPELYKESGLANIDKEKMIQYVEDNFSKTVTINGKTYNNLYRWSNEDTSPVSFEWSAQMAVTYKIYANYLEQNGSKDKAQEYYAKAEAIIADIKAYSQDLGFEDEYPYSDQSGVFNYSSYGWKVYKVEALSVDKQIDQYEWEEDGTGSFFFPISKIEGRDYTPSALNPNVYNNDVTDYIDVEKYSGSNWQTYAVSNIEFDATNIKEMTITLKLDPADYPSIGEADTIAKYPNASVQLQFLPYHAMNGYEDGTAYGWFEYPVYTFPANSDTLTITIDEELFNRYCNQDYWKSMYPNQQIYDIRMWDRSRFIVLSGESTFLHTTINNRNIPVAIESLEIKTKDGQTLKYATNYESQPTFEESLLKPGETVDNSAFVENESPLYLNPKWLVISNPSQTENKKYLLFASFFDKKQAVAMLEKIKSMGIDYYFEQTGQSLTEPFVEGTSRHYAQQIYLLPDDAIRLENEGFLKDYTDYNSILPKTMDLLNQQIKTGQSTIFSMILTILKKETWQSIFKPASFKKDHTTQAGQKGAGVVIGATHISMAVAFSTTIALLLTPIMSLFAVPFIGVITLGAITIATTFIIGIIGNMITHAIVDVGYIKGLGLEDAIKKYGRENVELTSTGIVIKDQGKVINIQPTVKKGFSLTMRVAWKKVIIGLMATIIIISVITTACASMGNNNTNPSTTPPAITQVDPTLDPTQTQIVDPTTEPTQIVDPTTIPTQIVEPTTEPTQVAEPTQTAEEKAEQAQFIADMTVWMSNFDDGKGLVDTYYTDGMLNGEFEKLSAEDKAMIVEDMMRDQAEAVMMYTNLGQTEDAKRILMEMSAMKNGDFYEYVMNRSTIDGARGVAWWNLACQQYYLATGDKDVIDFLQFLDGKGYSKI